MMLDLIDIHDRSSVGQGTFSKASDKKGGDTALSPTTVIDRKSALERTLGDERFFSELLQAFINELPDIRKRIELSLEQGNIDTIAKEAGCLAGAAGNLGATELSDAAFDLELAGRKGRFSELERCFNRLLLEVDRLVATAGLDEFDDPRRHKIS